MLKSLYIATKHPRGTFKRIFKLAVTFIAGQGLVQLIQLLSGFFLIHWLSVEQYAQYSITYAFQSTAQVLVELGFSGSVIALVGTRIYEKETIGKYIKTGKYFRNRLFVIIGIGCLIVFPYLTHHHNWSWHITILLLSAILINLFISGNNAFYITPLMIHRKLKEMYKIQLSSGTFRLIFLWVMHLLSAINAWIAVFTTCVAVWFNGYSFKKKVRPFIIEPEKSDKATQKEMFNYVKPVMPGIIYAAFSAQISLFIIGVFGDSRNIAEVGALGRIGQIFMIFNVASSTLIIPYLAKQHKRNLKKKFLTILTGAVAIAFLMSLFGFLFPQPFLWIMGPKYAGLDKEVGLLILNSSILFINVLMWDMNCARKWLWPWIPVVSISTNIFLQVIMVFTMNLSSTYNVLLFTIILSVFNLLNKILVTIIGLKRNRNEINLLSGK